ncbi:hypothetical protein [Streptomyces sp. YIM 98790]|uniref:hypothetical protein n=1 Tax=Streptomyces sp. YIM 98790 TaxID=2689077 RepID=UPI00140AD382|nr:hypothetical protein [Streptomyces sp. YIM 98790]
MIDPLSFEAVSTAVTAAAQGAGGEAGRQVWGSLTTLVRRTFGRGTPSEGPEDSEAGGTAAPGGGGDGAGEAEPALPLDPEDEGQVRELAALIFGRAFQDPEFAAEFRRWREQAEAAPAAGATQVVNQVTGNARVQNLVQGQNITFNGPLT